MGGIRSASKRLRRRFYYSVPMAGKKIGLGRSGSYQAARAGLIPTQKDGKFLLVQRGPWDREVKRLLAGTPPRVAKAGNETAAEAPGGA